MPWWYICTVCKSRQKSHGFWTSANPFAEVREYTCPSCMVSDKEKSLAVVQSQKEIAKIEADRDVAIHLAEVKKCELEFQAQLKKEEVNKNFELSKHQADQKMKVETTKIQSDAKVEITKIDSEARRYEEDKKMEAKKENFKLAAQKLEYDKMKLQCEHEEMVAKDKMKKTLEEKKHDMAEKLLFEKEYDSEKVVVLLNALSVTSPKMKSATTDPLYHYQPLLNIRILTVYKWKDNEGKQHRLNLINAMKNKWESMCDLMEIPMDTVEALVHGYKGDEEKCCRAILTYWVENGSPAFSATWENMSKILEELELDEVKIELEKALQSY